MLRAAEIEKVYPARGKPLRVLRGVSLSLDAGESAVVRGPSGCGKSTLLNILGTLDAPTAGRVSLDGVEPFGLREPDLARFRNQRIGFVFQDHHLLGMCDALENVLVPALAQRGGRDGPPVDRARELLERVGLKERLRHAPAELSGGERQRVAIARALVNRPRLVLADEPTGNLDRAAADAVADLLLELQRAEGFILVLVTHSERLAARFERRYELVDGVLVAAP